MGQDEPRRLRSLLGAARRRLSLSFFLFLLIFYPLSLCLCRLILHLFRLTLYLSLFLQLTHRQSSFYSPLRPSPPLSPFFLSLSLSFASYSSFFLYRVPHLSTLLFSLPSTSPRQPLEAGLIVPPGNGCPTYAYTCACVRECGGGRR